MPITFQYVSPGATSARDHLHAELVHRVVFGHIAVEHKLARVSKPLVVRLDIEVHVSAPFLMNCVAIELAQ